MAKKDQPESQQSALETVASGGEMVPFQPTDDDMIPMTHEERVVAPYAQIRQKPLLDERGKTVMDAGSIAYKDRARPDRQDVPYLMAAIIDDRFSRVYFENQDVKQPTCKSNDGVNGSRPREGDKYGTCVTCVLAKWDKTPDRRPACKEGRNLALYDLERNEFLVYTFTPAGIRPWVNYMNVLRAKAKDLNWVRNGREAPIAHLRVTKIEPEFNAEPKPHYAPKFTDMGWVPQSMFATMREAKRESAKWVTVAVEQQEHRAEEWVGTTDAPDDGTY